MKGVNMKKLFMVIPLVLLLCFTFSCKGKKANVERFMEDGVEVVLNFPLSQNKLANPILSQILSIDTENEDLVESGLNDIYGFDVNSSGDIFIFEHPLSQEDCILKFNGTGEFIKSFGNRGQGPGEIQYPFYQKINLNDEVSLFDGGNTKLLVFDGNGDIIRESKLEANLSGASQFLPLTNGNYLYRNLEIETDSYGLVLFLLDSKFEKIAELGRASVAMPNEATQFKMPPPVFTLGLSNTHIFVGLEERGYDIHVYDFEGQLIRKIRKEYTPVSFSEESKEQIMKRFESLPSIRKKTVMPKHNPPFKHLFADDLGRLYVVTFEPGKNQGEYMTDVFDTEGVLCSQLSLKLFLNAEIFMMDRPWDDWVTVKNDILYCIQEKESGHKELVAYKMKWE
jgi:hypothetical protein